MANNFAQIPHNSFTCINCDYYTSRKNDYNRHILTPKHREANKKQILDNFVAQNPQLHKCSQCDKIYKHRSSLCKHRQKCAKIQSSNIDTNLVIELLKQNKEKEISDKELMMTILKENSELKTMILDVCKNISASSITNNNVTNTSINNNKTFNIQVYLNEECKDALNLTDFVSSIQLQLHDLEETGRLGYVDGVSRIITTKLNDLDATKRPIQCSDVKRETLYIKDEDKWIKEDDKKEKIKSAIKQIAHKNIRQIPVWVEANPGCLDPDSKHNDTYLQIVSNAMSGSSTEEQCNNINKIVTKVSKEATIGK